MDGTDHVGGRSLLDGDPRTKPSLRCRWMLQGPNLQSGVPSSFSASRAWRPFSPAEDRRLEEAWQTLDVGTRLALVGGPGSGSGKGKAKQTEIHHADDDGRRRDSQDDGRSDTSARASQGEDDPSEDEEDPVLDLEADNLPHIVPVGQDNLFTVDVRKLHLFPAFWKGPRLRVQRCEWFYPATSSSKFYPCDSHLAARLEDAYEHIAPWSESYRDELRSALSIGEEAEDKLKVELPDLSLDVIFQGPNSARLFAQGVTGQVSKTVLTAFFGGARSERHGGGTLVVRGFDIAGTWKDRRGKKDASLPHRPAESKLSPDPIPPDARTPSSGRASGSQSPQHHSKLEDLVKSAKHRSEPVAAKVSNLVKDQVQPQPPARPEDGAGGGENTTADMIQGEDSGVEQQDTADLLVFCIHGIGQRLAAEWDSFSFVHAVNILRTGCARQGKSEPCKTILRGRRPQFIPLLWRNQLDFETNAGLEGDREDERLGNIFTLDDIQVKESIPFVRSIVSGLVLDVPLYMSHRHSSFVSAVIQQANLAYRLFVQRNPAFGNGKVHIVAHSLGSALITDILSAQPTMMSPLAEQKPAELAAHRHLCFNAGDVFFLGSPVAFFLHLHNKQLIARKGRARSMNASADVALDRPRYGCLALDSLYNVYAKHDPVAWCLNATVDAEYSRLLKPIRIPSATRTISEIIGASVVSASSKWTRLLSFRSAAPAEKDPVESSPPSAPSLRPGFAKRPSLRNKRLPSELNRGNARMRLADQRLRALNPIGVIDFELPSTGYSEYLDMVTAHASYWASPDLQSFLLLTLFGEENAGLLADVGREEIGQTRSDNAA